MQITPPRRKIGYPSEGLSPVKGISRAVKEVVHYQFVSLIRVILVDGSPQMQACIKEKDQGSQEGYEVSGPQKRAEPKRAATPVIRWTRVQQTAAPRTPRTTRRSRKEKRSLPADQDD